MQKIFILVLTIVMTMTNVLPTIAATTTRQQETTTAPTETQETPTDLVQDEETESNTETETMLPEETTPTQPEIQPDEPNLETETVITEEQESVETDDTATEVLEEKQNETEITTNRMYQTKQAPTVEMGAMPFRSQTFTNEFAQGQVNFAVDPAVEQAFQERVDDVQAFVPQSPQPYEVAVVTATGEYIFVEGQTTYESAIQQADAILEYNKTTIAETGDDDILTLLGVVDVQAETNPEIVDAVVLTSEGLITYSTQSNVVRILKTINGSIYSGCDVTTDLYTTASLSQTSGYINQCYVDDAALLGVQGDAAKILVAGKTAWIRISTDLAFVTPQQVTNPSYYANESGQFVHFITKNLTGTSGSGSKIILGPETALLPNGTKYYSYDGKYFYTNIETIGPDMADGVANQAVNATNPYYNYFLNLPFNSKAVATAAQINSYINANTQATSKLRNTGQAFIDAQEKYGINAMLMLGIAINESAWGMSDIAQTKNNLFGINAVDSNPGQAADVFASPAACIDEYAREWLAKGYADPQDWRYYGGMLGNKNMGANVKYASDPFWSEKAAAHLYTVDRGINGGSSKEWNYYSIGIFKTANSVKNTSGQEVYPITAPDANGALTLNSGYTETPIVLRETDSSDGKYIVWPARNNILNSSNNVPAAVPYNWNGNEYVNSNGVEVINVGKYNYYQGIETALKSMAIEKNVLELVSKATYSGSQSAGAEYITGVLISEDNSHKVTMNVQKLSSTDVKFSVDLNNLQSTKTYKFFISVGNNTEQVWKSGQVNLPTQLYGETKIIEPLMQNDQRFAIRVTEKPFGIRTSLESMKVQNSNLAIVTKASYANGVAPIQDIKAWLVDSQNGEKKSLDVKKISDMNIELTIPVTNLSVDKTYKVLVQVGNQQEYVWKSGQVTVDSIISGDYKISPQEFSDQRFAIKVEKSKYGIKTSLKSISLNGEILSFVSQASYLNEVAQLEEVQGYLKSRNQNIKVPMNVKVATADTYVFEIDSKYLEVGDVYDFVIKVGTTEEQVWKSGQVTVPNQLDVLNKRIKPIFNTEQKTSITIETLLPTISYQTHVQGYGWQNWVKDGQTSGTMGESKRLEAIKIQSTELPKGVEIQYRTHVQDYGWQNWVKDGQTSGTTGQSKRLEAIQINLIGSEEYSVEYRAHVQDYGWQDWVKDGQISGTSGQSKRLEAIQIRIVKK